MSSWWWLALPVLLLPIWWHRQKRVVQGAQPLASARFLPRTDPQQRRIWRWADLLLLLVRCLLLATVIVWLADIVLPWRGDSVLVAPGTDPAWRDGQIKKEGFTQATLIDVPTQDIFGWLGKHEREWQREARLLVLGEVPMPAVRPAISHHVTVHTTTGRRKKAQHRIYIVSERASQWQALFRAADGASSFLVSTTSDDRADLIIWDVPQAPPATLRARLWWIGDATAFPELNKATVVEGLRYAHSARGRLWANPAWPVADADAARRQFETWQRLHFAPLPYTMASQALVPTTTLPGSQLPINGALRYFLTFALCALFVIERVLAHAKSR